MSDADASTKRMLPWLIAVAFFMESLDTTILNTAVPTMAEALKVAPLAMKSVLSSYTLSLAVFIPVSSWIADRFGTRVFASAIGIFTLGSLLCGLCNDIRLLVLCRILQGCGGAMMVPVGRLTLVRSFARSELVQAMTFVAIPALIGPMLGPLVGGMIVGYSHWRVIFSSTFRSDWPDSYLVHKNLPDFREVTEKLDLIGLILFGSGISLLSYVLEVFGDHSLGKIEILGLFGVALVLLAGYANHARLTKHPLLRLNLFRIRTMRIAVAGSFITRMGVGGMPFLLPLLYQIGLGYSPVQSGLLIMPQSIAAIALRILMPRILRRFGYKQVLQSNTIGLGVIIALFATITPATPVALIILQACIFGFLSSMQFTSMNTLVYADVQNKDTSMASTIVSTAQQTSLSFGVATASLVAAFFVPETTHANSGELLEGIHRAFILLGGWTVLSALVFKDLKADDGENVSRHKMTAAQAPA